MPSRIFSAAKFVWLIVAVSVLAHLRYLYLFQRDHPRQAISVIPFLFEVGNIARSIGEGHGFSSPFLVNTGPTAWMTPLFPTLLAGIFRIFGVYTFHAWLAVVLINIACCVVTIFPVYAIGTRLGGKSLGASAGWLWAIFPNAILLPVESMWDASLSALLAITILWATLALDDSRTYRNWCAYGLLWGVALMTNATLGAILPFLLAWLAYRSRKTDPRWLAKVATSAFVVILCCVPWTIRNYSVFHAFVPLRSVLGLQLWLGNNDLTQDVFRGTSHPIYSSKERAHYVEVGELAYMQEKKQAALGYMLTNPSRVLHLSFRRFVSIWSGGTPYPLFDFMQSSSWWFRYVVAFNLLAAFGALCGVIILFRQRSAYAVPLALFPVIYPWAFYLTLALPRYRLPIDPIVMLLFAVTLHQLAGGNKLQPIDVAVKKPSRKSVR